MNTMEFMLRKENRCMIGTKDVPDPAPRHADILWEDGEWALYRWDGCSAPRLDRWRNLEVGPVDVPNGREEDANGGEDYRPEEGEYCWIKGKNDPEHYYGVDKVLWSRGEYAVMKPPGPDLPYLCNWNDMEVKPVDGDEVPELSTVRFDEDGELYTKCLHCGTLHHLSTLEQDDELTSIPLAGRDWDRKLEDMPGMCSHCYSVIMLGRIV